MNEALTVLIWTVSVVLAVPFLILAVCLIIGLVSGLIDIAKDKRKKRKEGNA